MEAVTKITSTKKDILNNLEKFWDQSPFAHPFSEKVNKIV